MMPIINAATLFPERDALIVELHRDGHSVKYLAERFSLSLKMVKAILSFAGIDPAVVSRSLPMKVFEQYDLDLREKQERIIRRKRRQQVGRLSRTEGWVYLLQLEPRVAPERIKVGFSREPISRLKQAQTYCPDACLVEQWPAIQREEYEILDYLDSGAYAVRINCSEVFICPDIKQLLVIIDQKLQSMEE